MICDARTCAGCRYLEQDDPATSLAEFLADCQHAKCKVVRLVRQQISKLQNMQVGRPYERLLAADEGPHVGARNETQNDEAFMTPHETFYGEVHEVYDELYESPDAAYKVRVKAEQANDEETYRTQKAAATARETVEATSATGVSKAVRPEDDAVTAPSRRAAPPERAVDRKLMLRLLDCVRHRARLVLAAATLGVIAWTALVYGVFLGATACGSGRGCYASSFRYAHAKRSLF
ncbi:hypothetical protein DMN91_011442 [Ooceraea biroi]|uniref:Uncharacterized protein n=1 Tax=Ooceraea biroi TaxID=2015173 RepID=A0A3L8D5B8_OOCBI|nr:hypothetical protein DMN91_011442 [Ooceraea biroi]